METHPPLDTGLYRLGGVLKRPKISSKSAISEQKFTINAYPPLEDINLAYRDLVLYWEWNQVALLYTGTFKSVKTIILKL